MNILFWGLTIGVIGKVLLAVGVLIAHSEIAHERKIDSLVLRSFKKEKILTILGLFLIVAGYCMEMYFYGFDTSLLTCSDAECAVGAAAILSQ